MKASISNLAIRPSIPAIACLVPVSPIFVDRSRIQARGALRFRPAANVFPPVRLGAAPAADVAAASRGRVFAPRSVPTAGTEAALRSFVAGLATGSPDYAKLSPQFAEVVRQQLPMTQGRFASLGGADVVGLPRARRDGRRCLRRGVPTAR
jgi:hypothetical protein